MEEELDSIHHIAITVADIEQSLRWYQSSFRCQVLFQDTTKVVLQFANVKVTLVLPSQQQPHVAYIRDDAETLGELRSGPEGALSTFIADPTGNPVEIVSRQSIDEQEPSQ